MSIVYLGSGIFLLVGNNIFDFSDFQKFGFSGILIAYGLIRFYLTLKKIKEDKENDYED